MTTTAIYIRPREPQLSDLAEGLNLTIPTGRHRSVVFLFKSEKHEGALWLDPDDVTGRNGEEVLRYLSAGLKSGVVDLGNLLIPASGIAAIWKEDASVGAPVEL